MNNELIPTTANQIAGQETQTVNARDLHTFLEVGRDYTTWIKERISEYNFNENEDFVCSTNLVSKKGRGGHNRIDYHITLDMAKELAMVERTEKGRQARKYFIECERRLRNLTTFKALPPPTLTPDQQRKIQQLVAEKVYATENRAMYPTLFKQLYRAIKDEFKVGKYNQVPASQFDALTGYIGKINHKPISENINRREFEAFKKLMVAHLESNQSFRDAQVKASRNAARIASNLTDTLEIYYRAHGQSNISEMIKKATSDTVDLVNGFLDDSEKFFLNQRSTYRALLGDKAA
jgi:phage anti-repressor protein